MSWIATNISDSNMNVRNNPTTSGSSIVGLIVKGAKVQIASIINGERYRWGQIENHHLEGNWTAIEYLETHSKFYSLKQIPEEPPPEDPCAITVTNEGFKVEDGDTIWESYEVMKIGETKFDIVIVEKDDSYVIGVVFANPKSVQVSLKEGENDEED